MSLYARIRKSADQLERGENIMPNADWIESIHVDAMSGGIMFLVIDDDTRAEVHYAVPDEVAEKLLRDLSSWNAARRSKTN